MESTAGGKGCRSHHVFQSSRDIGGRMALDNGRIDEDVAFETVTGRVTDTTKFGAAGLTVQKGDTNEAIFI